MIEALKNFDQQITIWLNNQHTPFFDDVMYWISDKYIWVPFYAFLVLLMVFKLKKHSITALLAIAILITLSDQFSVHFFKEVFERFRPCRDGSPIHEMIHIVRGHCGGKYGFVSSHASNTFALAVFLALIIGKYFRYFTPLIILWAAIVSYSRVYLGVHYLGDILGGAILGAILGIILAYVFHKSRLYIDNFKKSSSEFISHK